jgi:integrase
MENILTKEQRQKLREMLRGHEREALITLALVTGMRRDELLRLQWQDIDLEKRELRVQSTKTKSICRIIHCSESLTQLLKQHRLRQSAALSEAEQAWPNLDLVFPDRTGGFLKPEQLLQEFSGILEQAALPHLRFHDLRKAWWQALCARFQIRKDGPASAQAAYLGLDEDIYPQ